MNVCLLVLDCLRLDYWGQMEQAQAVTKDWFYFDNHWAVAHCSDPNHAALFTGYGPWETGVTTQMGMPFKTRLPTLFWRWKRDIEDGYTCALQPVKTPAFYRDYVDDLAWHKGTDSADLDLKAIKAFLEEAGSRPFLMFIRDMTCHYPYLDLDMPARGEAGEIRPQYEQAVAHVDEFTARLVETLPDNTIVIICSDHGELLGEHGEYDHLYRLWSYLTRTPMVVRVPGLDGKATQAPTQHIDLWPTLCNLLEIKMQGEGQSWGPWMRGEAESPTDENRKMWLQGTGAGPVSDEHLEAKGGSAIDPGLGRVLWRHRGLVWNGWKYIEDVHADGVTEAHLTDPNDYTERRDYVENRNRIVKRMKAHVPPVPDYHSWEQRLVNKRRHQHDQIILERLKALGYA